MTDLDTGKGKTELRKSVAIDHAGDQTGDKGDGKIRDEQSQSWVGRFAASICDETKALLQEPYVKEIAAVGIGALAITAVVASRGKLGPEVEQIMAGGFTKGLELEKGGANLALTTAEDFESGALYMKKTEPVASSSIIPNLTVTDEAVPAIKLAAPPTIQPDFTELPALLKNKDLTVDALMKARNDPAWEFPTKVTERTRQDIKDSLAAMPELPPGVPVSAATLKNYHGADGLRWLDSHNLLETRDRVASSVSTSLAIRAPLLKDAFTGLGSRLGVPIRDVKFERPATSQLWSGIYKPGTGVFKIDSTLQSGFDDAVEICTHEFTHAEQDKLIVSRLADSLKLGKAISPDETAELSRLYADTIGTAPKQYYLRDVMRARDGIQLSPAVAERADGLIGSVQAFMDNSGNISRADRSSYLLSLMREDFEVRTSRATLNEFIGQAEDDPTVKRLLESKPFADLLSRQTLDEFGKIENMSLPKSKLLDTEFEKLLEAENQRIDAERDVNDTTYKRWWHEDESFKVGDYFRKRIGKLTGEVPELILQLTATSQSSV